MNVSASLLARLTFNAGLYVNAQSLRTKGLSRFRILNHTLSVLASDDYIAVFDIGSIEGDLNQIEFALGKEELSKLEKYSRENKKFDGELSFDRKFENLTFAVGEDSINIELPEFPDSVEKNYILAESFIFDEEDFPETMTEVFAFHPDRVAKLYRLKANDNPPVIDMKFCETNADPMIRFKYGESIRGIIAPSRRGVIEERFLWKNYTEA